MTIFPQPARNEFVLETQETGSIISIQYNLSKIRIMHGDKNASASFTSAGNSWACKCDGLSQCRVQKVNFKGSSIFKRSRMKRRNCEEVEVLWRIDGNAHRDKRRIEVEDDAKGKGEVIRAWKVARGDNARTRCQLLWLVVAAIDRRRWSVYRRWSVGLAAARCSHRGTTPTT